MHARPTSLHALRAVHAHTHTHARLHAHSPPLASAHPPTLASYAPCSSARSSRSALGSTLYGLVRRYANPDAFFDVVKGTNAYGRGSFTTPIGYACAPGWDAATGLGTPHFDKLLAAALAAGPVSKVVEQA